MKRILYDLAGADPNLRFSPYCWRIKLALAHKGIAADTIPWRFSDKGVIAFSGQGLVPVLVDGGATVTDSQAIAEYLEATYPNEASLFGDPPAKALTYFIKQWTEETLHPVIAKIVLPDIFKILDPKDQPYFRQTREARFGMTIEELGAQREQHLPAFEAACKPVRATLAAQSFIAGSGPAYADHIVFGALQWARKGSATPLLADDDIITLWMDAVLAAYGVSG